MRRVLLVAVIGVAALVGASRIGALETQEHDRLVLVESDGPRLSLEGLLAESDAVAIVEPHGAPYAHWNSRAGKEWESTDAERVPWIYQDVQAEVVTSLRGKLSDMTIVIRGVGGTVDGVTLVVGDQPEWAAGTRYLVFLKYRQTPMEKGTDGAWTEAVLGQSTFVLDGDKWKNALTGLKTTLDELAD